MPVEIDSMLILIAAVAKIEGNEVREFWPRITAWAKYLE